MSLAADIRDALLCVATSTGLMLIAGLLIPTLSFLIAFGLLIAGIMALLLSVTSAIIGGFAMWAIARRIGAEIKAWRSGRAV